MNAGTHATQVVAAGTTRGASADVVRVALAATSPELHAAMTARLRALAARWGVALDVTAADASAAPHVAWLVGAGPQVDRLSSQLATWRATTRVAAVHQVDVARAREAACAWQADDLVLTDLVASDRPADAALATWTSAALGRPDPAQSLPATGAAPRAGAAWCVRVRPGDGPEIHWLDAPHARGWFLPAAAAEALREPDEPAAPELWQGAATLLAMARGLVAADALTVGLSLDREGGALALPALSWGLAPVFMHACAPGQAAPSQPVMYAIVDDAERLARCAEAGAGWVQLRAKRAVPLSADEAAALRDEIGQCLSAAQAHGALLFINDHRELALAAGARGLHLGQEDLLALSDDERAALRAPGQRLGIS